MRGLRGSLLGGVLLVSACHGQELWDTVSLRTAQTGGLRLYGVSAYSGYSTFSGPILQQQQIVPAGLNIGSDTSYGVQWGLGWLRQKGKTTGFVTYNGNYGGRIRYSNLNSFGHTLTIGLNRQLRTKWNLNMSALADYRTLVQYLFQPSWLSVLSQLPANASDLGAAFSAGNFSNNQTAAMLTGAPDSAALLSPVRNLLIADRILSYGFQSSASYQYSSRLNFTFSSITAGGERTFDNNPSYSVPRTLGISAGAAFATSYSLSPRTTVGISLGEMYTSNQAIGSYVTSSGVSLGRMMGPHWFLSVRGGMSYIKLTQNIYGTQSRRETTGGGSLGYRLYAHTLLATYNRAAGAAGIPGALNSTAVGAWSWHRPGSGWNVYATGGQFQIRNAGFTSFTGWRGNVGVSRMINRQVSAHWEYAYLDSSGSYLTIRTDRTVHAIRVSLRWQPLGVSHDDTDQQFPGLGQP